MLVEGLRVGRRLRAHVRGFKNVSSPNFDVDPATHPMNQHQIDKKSSGWIGQKLTLKTLSEPYCISLNVSTLFAFTLSTDTKNPLKH